MILSVRSIPTKSPLHLELGEADDWFQELIEAASERDLAQELSLSKPLCKLKLLRKNSSIFLEGAIEATIPLICSRTGKNFAFPINVQFKTTFITKERARGLADQDFFATAQEADLDVHFLESEELDLKQIIGEQIFLNLPYQPLSPEAEKQSHRDYEDHSMGAWKTNPFSSLKNFNTEEM